MKRVRVLINAKNVSGHETRHLWSAAHLRKQRHQPLQITVLSTDSSTPQTNLSTRSLQIGRTAITSDLSVFPPLSGSRVKHKWTIGNGESGLGRQQDRKTGRIGICLLILFLSCDITSKLIQDRRRVATFWGQTLTIITALPQAEYDHKKNEKKGGREW